MAADQSQSGEAGRYRDDKLKNQDVLLALQQLRSNLSSGQADIEDASVDFERLTFLLDRVMPSEERELSALVNDIERIRFTRRPENQLAAVDEVFGRAEALFAHWI